MIMKTDQMLKKTFQPVEIQVFNYKSNDILLESNKYAAFLGEEDNLDNSKPRDEVKKEA